MMEEEKKEKEVMETENPSNKYSDGEQIKNFMKEASSKRDTMGRQVIYTLIAVLWAITSDIFHLRNTVCLFRLPVSFCV